MGRGKMPSAWVRPIKVSALSRQVKGVMHPLTLKSLSRRDGIIQGDP